MSSGELKAELSDYRWSSFRAYIGLAKKTKWLDRNHVLSSWGCMGAEKIANYRRYVEEGLLSDNSGDLSPCEISCIIGTDSFKDSVVRKHLIRDMKDIDAKEEPELAMVNSPLAEDVVEVVRAYFNLDVENNGARTAFVGAYALSRDIISLRAAYAGAWRLASPGNVVEADRRILMIHPLKSGKTDLILKEQARLSELPSGNMSFPKAMRHSLELKAGKTYLFEQLE
ncbi:MAG: hypothetical protein WAX69_02570 [Victivallales bacterium]